MTSKVRTITAILSAFIPWLIFAPRRLNRSFNENNPVNSIMDVQICAAQSANAIQGANTAIKYSKLGSVVADMSAESNIKNMSQAAATAEKSTSLFGKIANFTRNNINPIIGISLFVNALLSDNIFRNLIIALSTFLCMLGGENIANNLFGRPSSSFKNGNFKISHREAKYKNIPFLNKAFTKANKFIVNLMSKNKRLAKYTHCVPGVGTGIAFAGFSIAGCTIGDKFGKFCADKVAPIEQAA